MGCSESSGGANYGLSRPRSLRDSHQREHFARRLRQRRNLVNSVPVLTLPQASASSCCMDAHRRSLMRNLQVGTDFMGLT